MYRISINTASFLLLTVISYAQPRKFHFSAMKMGSPFNIVIVSGDSIKAADLARRSFSLVDSFNTVYSDYDSTSELGRLNKSAGMGPQKVSEALWDILMRSKDAFQRSHGAFDITVGPLSQLWRAKRKQKAFPRKIEVDDARKLVDFNHLSFLPQIQAVVLTKQGMRIDLGGIAKGYIAQKVIEFLLKNGITQALADAGGDMVMSNAPPETAGWIVGVNIPESTDDLLPKRLALQNMAVATSGDAYQYIEHEGIRYSHIIDPRTGYGITSQRNVTVIARNGTDADWLATACSIAPIETAKKLAISMKAELLITVLKDGKIVYYATDGFRKYWKVP